MTIERPMFPPIDPARRRLLSVAADGGDAAMIRATPDGQPITKDDELGVAWWNALTKQERAKWSAIAGNTGRVKDAWEAFKRASLDQNPLPEADEKPVGGSTRPADGIALLRLVGPEREIVAALLAFVACGLTCGSTLDQMEAVAFNELLRAGKLAAQKRHYRWIIPVTAAEKATTSSPKATAVRS